MKSLRIVTATIISFTGDEKTAIKMGSKMGAMMITMQVKMLDLIWGKLAKIVTDKENHKTESRYSIVTDREKENHKTESRYRYR